MVSNFNRSQFTQPPCMEELSYGQISLCEAPSKNQKDRHYSKHNKESLLIGLRGQITLLNAPGSVNTNAHCINKLSTWPHEIGIRHGLQYEYCCSARRLVLCPRSIRRMYILITKIWQASTRMMWTSKSRNISKTTSDSKWSKRSFFNDVVQLHS